MATYLGLALLWVAIGGVVSGAYWIYSQGRENKGRSVGEIIRRMPFRRQRYLVLLVFQSIIYFALGLAIIFVPGIHSWVERFLSR